MKEHDPSLLSYCKLSRSSISDTLQWCPLTWGSGARLSTEQCLGRWEAHSYPTAVLFTINDHGPLDAQSGLSSEGGAHTFLPTAVLITSPLFFCHVSKAFAWWSDLMVEHAETFLSLFAVDMDAALEVQPPDSWDSFPLFQLLNDFLRTDCMYHPGLLAFPD